MVPDIAWLLENCVEPVLEIGCFLVRHNSWAEVASQQRIKTRQLD
jgi:hypothetical protein